MTINSYQEIANQFKSHFATNGYPFHFEHFPPEKFVKPDWIRIPINFKHYNAKLLPFIIASNELFRFQLAGNYPENLLNDGFIMSRRVMQDDEVGEFRVRTLHYYRNAMLGENPPIWHGMGRGIFLKYFYQDNDFNVNNAIVDKDDNFIVVDHDQCLWPVVEKYHYYKDFKVLTVNNYPGHVKQVKSLSGEPLYLIPDKKKNFIGKMHVKDYDVLPLLNHQFPTCWFLQEADYQGYARKLAENKMFNAEKHFATLKIFVTLNIQKLLLNLHTDNKIDLANACQFLEDQHAKLKTVCQQSVPYQQYLINSGADACAAIKQEINAFFRAYHYYYLPDQALMDRMVELMLTDSAQQFDKHLIDITRCAQIGEVA